MKPNESSQEIKVSENLRVGARTVGILLGRGDTRGITDAFLEELPEVFEQHPELGKEFITGFIYGHSNKGGDIK